MQLLKINRMIKNLFGSLCILLVISSCESDLPGFYEFEPYAYSSTDLAAGDWKPVLIADAGAFQLPDPAPVGSDAYKSELAELKSLSENPDARQKDAIQYWNNDGLVRWNETICRLISKYNLPPAPNDDDSYGVPNAAAPDQYPYFPFAHPTYACRALAYMSGAHYDALISAWKLKSQFNRARHQTADPSIRLHLPASELPSYPAEGAVIAAVSEVMLSALFPLDKIEIQKLSAEHKNSLMWAGKHVKSDITAGDSLGRIIAAEFLKRAATDGMKNAQSPKAISDSIRQAAETRFGWYWKNLEDPERPVGITPLFGKVKPWFIPNVETVRPGPPPAIGSPEFIQAANELKDIQKNLTKKQRAIANFYADGIGTYSPPGHWNRIAAEKIVEARLSPVRAARIIAYMNYAIMDAGISCWDTKYFYHYPRPSQAIPGFKTILGIPNFPAYTSGHSTFSSAAGKVLSHFFPSAAAEFDAVTIEASLSRLYGGIHYRFDSEVGVTSGHLVAEYSVNRAKLDGAE